MITHTKADRCSHIRLEADLNKLSFHFTSQLSDALLDAEKDDSVSVIILSGNGRAFSVGADLSELINLDPTEVSGWLAPWETLSAISKPVIVCIEGYAMGGGLEISLMGDILIAADSAKFAQPEVKLALLPGCGGTLRLLQAVGYHRAVEMCLTGEVIDATRAYDIGLVNYVLPAGEIYTKAQELATSMARLSLPALQSIKKLMRTHYDASAHYTHALKDERKAFIKLLLTHDGREGLKAFIEKRTPVYHNQ